MNKDNTFYSKLITSTYKNTKKERLLISKKYGTSRDIILQIDNKFLSPELKPSQLTTEYIQRNKEKPEKHKIKRRYLPSNVFPDEEKTRESIRQSSIANIKKRKLREDYEKRIKRERPKTIKIFPNKNNVSNIADLIANKISTSNDNNQIMHLRHHSHSPSYHNENVYPCNTHSRIFKYGNFENIQEKKKFMLKAMQYNEFNQARKDNLKDLMDHHKLFREPDDNITVKPNQISYRSLVTQTKRNLLEKIKKQYQ